MKLKYKCSFCDTRSKTKDTIQQHEKQCIGNPLNKHCVTCIHIKEVLMGFICGIGNEQKSCKSWCGEE